MTKAIMLIVSLWLMLDTLIARVRGHGRLLEPPGRASMWRFGYNSPPNYDDNQLFCGGFNRQWKINGGKCGVCGDPWNGPREHEAGGKYATGTIVRHYTEGQTITVNVQITASHRGYFEFRLCPHNNPSSPVTQTCLDQHLLQQTDGSTKFYERGHPTTYTIQLKLPAGVTCSQCLLQWKYNAGNSYGCDGSHCCIGCGEQEQFYGCSDISIGSDGKQGQLSVNLKNPLIAKPQNHLLSTGVHHQLSNSLNNKPVNVQAHVTATEVHKQLPSSPSLNHENVLQQSQGLPIGILFHQSSSSNQIPSNPILQNHVVAPGIHYQMPPSSNQNPDQSNYLPVGYLPLNVFGHLPGGSGSMAVACKGTPGFKAISVHADQYCRTVCSKGSCPNQQYCTPACRGLSRKK